MLEGTAAEVSDNITYNIGLSKYGSDDELAEIVLFRDYSDELLNFGFACCLFFMLIGIAGNLITIIALACCEKVRNATALFLINLHTSDLLFCCVILPMTAVTFSTKHWVFGRNMCRVYPFLKNVLNATSLFTAVAITINRCIMICHPHVYSKIYRTKVMAWMICTIWLSAFAIFLVSLFEKWGLFDIEPNGGGLCAMVPDRYGRSPKKLYLLIAFVGPYLIMAICYARIWWVVRRTATKCNKNSSTMNLTAVHVQRNPSKCGSNLMLKKDDATVTGSVLPTSATTPNEDKPLIEYFKAPFSRFTVKAKKLDAPTKRDKKLLTLIYAILISFGLCHFPLLLTKMLYSEYKSNPTANVLPHLLEYSASCINPIIYVVMSSEYRKVYGSLYDSVKLKMFGR